jgi:ectoine hydroxylase-related dioxygenase (phytanoyl-CoA dioxygenase family)
VAHSKGYKRGEATTDMVLSWARELDPDAALQIPDIQDGDAIIFDGRLWHGTNNTRSEGTRTAILLQYASASRPVRMIDFERLEWPFQYVAGPRPPVLVVAGTGDAAINRIVEPPQCA